MTEIAKIEATVIEIKRQWYDKLRVTAVYEEANTASSLVIDLPIGMAQIVYIGQKLNIVVTTAEADGV